MIDVKFKEQGKTYRFDVTLQHDDTGWDHYADRREALSPDRAILATRVLDHPHDNEQPFTRSFSDVQIPHEVKYVEIK